MTRGIERQVNTKRRWQAWLVPMVVALMLALSPAAMLAKQDASPVAGGGGGTLIGAFDVGPGGCPECPNPLQAGAGFTWYEMYFSKLMLYDVDFTQINGELAESWEISDDATQYTIKLRDGVLWHDGEQFTSEDVKFTIELAAAPGSASYIGAKFSGVTSIETPDDLTVVLTLETGNATLLDAFTFLVMLPEHELSSMTPEEVATSQWWLSNPVGTGPFQWSQYEPGQFIELVAFEDYWRGRPNLDRIINRFYPEAGSAVIALRSGEIQFTYMTTDEALALEGSEGFSVLSGPSQVVNYLGFDLTDPRFQDERVRQAFMYAIDRNAIVDQLFSGEATVVSCAYLLDQYVPDDTTAYDADPDQARQLLEEAGFDFSQPVEVLTYYSDQLSQDVLVTMQQFLSEAGVEMTIRSVDVPTYNLITPDSDQWDVTYAGAANGPDPDVLSTHFESKEANESVLNRSNIADDELDRLFAEGRAETDPDARAQDYQDVCSIMNEQAYWAPMWVTTRFGGVSDNVENFVWTPAPGGGRYYDASETWIVNEES